jgi:hypothetical protein
VISTLDGPDIGQELEAVITWFARDLDLIEPQLPKQYFDFFRLTRVQIHVVPTVDGTSAAAHALRRLLSFDHDEDDER